MAGASATHPIAGRSQQSRISLSLLGCAQLGLLDNLCTSVPLTNAPAFSGLIDKFPGGAITLVREFLLLLVRGDYILGCDELRVAKSELALKPPLLKDK